MGAWLSPGLWSETSRGPEGPAQLGGVPGHRAGYKHGRGGGRQEGGAAVRQPAGGRQAERPLLAGSLWAHLAEQRQWWLLPQPSLLPNGTASDPWVSRTTPRHPAGRSREHTGRAGPRGAWCPWGMELYGLGCGEGVQASTLTLNPSSAAAPSRRAPGAVSPPPPQPPQGSEPLSWRWGHKGPLFRAPQSTGAPTALGPLALFY